jgi:hypothetical protein
MDTRKRIASLERELVELRHRLEEHKQSVIELERVDAKEAPLIRSIRDRVARKIVSTERRIAVLRDEPDEVVSNMDTVNDNEVDELIEVLDNTAPQQRSADAQVLEEIRAHAAACDEHAAALAVNIKALHSKITALRMSRDGRGPSSIVVPSALERAAAKYFTGTVLRSIRGPVPRPSMGGFKEQVEMWMPSLSPPRVPPSPAPPPPPPMSPSITA